MQAAGLRGARRGAAHIAAETAAESAYGTAGPYDDSVPTKPDEPRTIAAEKLRAIKGLSWEELDAYESRNEHVTGPSGRRYRVSSAAYWDMEPWASGIEISVKVFADKGVRRVWPYKARAVRGGPDDPVPELPLP